MIEVWCGTDVSKRTLDVAIDWNGKFRTLQAENKTKGFVQLIEWARKVAGPESELKFCMESTGDYGVEFALWLCEQGIHVSVVNPARVKFFGMGKGRLNKTDKADAKLIAEFALANQPEAWDLSDPTRRELFRLHRRKEQLMKMEVCEMNRKECPTAIGANCLASIDLIVKAIRDEISRIEADMMKLVASDPEHQNSVELIVSIPVLAQGSALRILAEMPLVEKAESAKEWAAAAGGHPTRKESGTSIAAGRMARGGRRMLRSGLWMPTLLGLKKMPELRSLYDRLILKGKTHRQAMVACLRKLLMIVYGVLKNKRPYEPRPASA